VSSNRTATKCPVCKSDKYRIWITPTKPEMDPAKLYGAASGIKGAQQIVICNECGMKYENPRLSDKDILKGYMSSEDGDHDSQYEMRVRSFKFALVRNKRNLKAPSKKILDIGTAGGAFLEAAEQLGYEAYGLEPSLDLVARGNSRGLKIFSGTIEQNQLTNEQFGVISLWDVIEHLPNPASSLELARKHLQSGGLLIINFPNIGTLQAKIAGRKFWWIISVHLHHFSQSTLNQLCKSAGFEHISSKRYFQILEFGYLVEIATKLGVPLSGQIERIIPKLIKKIPLPYYASQTTSIYRKA
jgi:2-polyprenyl-3-methyl-5-hydroxy-6-metoxy-1,4-benzoquinol methylase